MLAACLRAFARGARRAKRAPDFRAQSRGGQFRDSEIHDRDRDPSDGRMLHVQQYASGQFVVTSAASLSVVVRATLSTRQV